MARDPTGTGKLRSRFRADTRKKLTELLALVEAVLVTNDLLGLRPFEHPLAFVLFPGGGDRQAKLRTFSDWFNSVVYATLLAGGGLWMLRHLEDAYAAGVAAIARNIVNAPAAGPMERFLLERAVHDLEGIADATVARATRVVADELAERNFVASRIARAVNREVRDTATNRLIALANTSIVQANNAGRIAEIRATGASVVGIVPETLPVLLGAAAIGLAGAERVLRRRRAKIITAGDDRVCDECDALARGGPYDVADAEAMLPVHPNCRCAFVLVEDLEAARRELQRRGITPRI